MTPIYWKSYVVPASEDTGSAVKFEGWSHVREERHGHQPIGIFDSYVSALAAHMGLWEEYCAFHRTGRAA